MRRWLRWFLLLVCLACLARIVFGTPNGLAVAGFFASGAAWYWLTWRRIREADALGRR